MFEAVGERYTVNEGDGAFYGPKIDIKLVDAIGRDLTRVPVRPQDICL